MATTSQNAAEAEIESFAIRTARSVLAGATDHAGITEAMSTLADPVGKMMAAIATPLTQVGSSAAQSVIALSAGMAAASRFTVAAGDDAAAAGGTRRPPPGDDPAQWPSIIAELIEELFGEDAADSEEGKQAARIFRELADLVTSFQVSGLPGIPGMPGGGPFIPGQIIERVEREIAKRLGKLRDLIDRLRRLLPAGGSRFDLALQMLKDEMFGPLIKRALIGTVVAVPGVVSDVMTGAGLAGRDLRSWRDLGIEVHEELQRRYRSEWLSKRFPARVPARYVVGYVLQDEHIYYHPMMSVPLNTAATKTHDGSLNAFMIARLPERSFMKYIGGGTIDQLWGMYREDTVDSRTGEVWEVKPVRSTSLGVYQEFHYRHGFNLVNALLLDLRDLFAGSSRGKRATRSLLAKFTYFSREFPFYLVPGQGLLWEPLKTPFNAGAKTGRPVAIVPVTVPQLEGLVLYFVFDLPIGALLALSATIAKTLQEKIEQWLRELAKTVEQILDAIVQFLTILAFFLAIIVVAYLLFVALGALIGGAAAGAAAGALRALGVLIMRFAPRLVPVGAAAGGATATTPISDPDVFLREILRRAKEGGVSVAVPPRIIGDALVIQFENSTKEGYEHTPIDVGFGPIRFSNLPASAIWLVEITGTIAAAVAAGAYREFLGGAAPVA